MSTPPPGSGRFGATLGLFLLAEHEDGAVEVALDATDAHEREGGIVHGGVMMTLLDSAMAAAVRRTLEPGTFIASASITTDFLKPAKAGRLVARGWVERKGRTMAFPRGELRWYSRGDDAADGRVAARDDTAAVVARASGIWAIRSG